MIVGGGLLGLATAWALRGRRDVLVLERDTIGHGRGGSHGANRIFRLGYADPHYVELAQRALGSWSRLETEAGVQLLHPTPQLTFGPGADAVYDALTSGGRAGGTHHRVGDRGPLSRVRGPGRRSVGNDFGRDRGGSHAGGVARGFGRDGARTRAGCAARCRARRAGGRDHRGAHRRGVCRAVDPALVPAVPTTATLEHAGFVRMPAALPIFIDFTDPAVYGLPTPGSDLYKIAVHHGGPAIDPDAPFAPVPGAVAALRERDRTVVAGGRTGRHRRVPLRQHRRRALHRAAHRRDRGGGGYIRDAFKFGPLLGEQLAALVADHG